MGNKVLRKTYTESYKQRKRMASPKHERVIFEGAIPQIIDPETWHTAQRLRRTIRRPAKNGDPPYRLTGLMYCADCNSKMTHDRTEDRRTIKSQRKNHYLCSNYRQRRDGCSMHFIKVPAAEELILDAVKRVAYYVRTNEEEFVAKVREKSVARQESVIQESKKNLTKQKRRRDELDTLIKKLYETFATGKIPEKLFDKMIAEYYEEQTSLEASIAGLQNQIDTWGADIEKTDKFIELANQYTDFAELSDEMVNRFIEKIVVHEADRSTGARTQHLEIHFNFIGNFVPPVMEIPLMPKEVAKLKADTEEAERLEQERIARKKEIAYRKNLKYRQRLRDDPVLRAEQNAKRKELYAQMRMALYEKAVAEGEIPPRTKYKPDQNKTAI